MGIKIGVNCMICGSEFESEEPKYCCNGRDCGCMGMQLDPDICSNECYEKFRLEGLPKREPVEFEYLSKN